MSKVLIIGGGAAGMMAGVFAGRNGHEVHIFEKNEKLGKKLFITGKGRCNITNNCDVEELINAVKRNNKFLYSAFYTFTNDQVVDFFEDLGVRTKVERGGRVFPKSDHSSDVIRALHDELKSLGVKIYLNTPVVSIKNGADGFVSIKTKDGKVVTGDSCIVATGGVSYASTGSTGDGHDFARKAGLKVTKLYPSLVPIEVKEDFIRFLQGLSLKNIEIKITDGKKKTYYEEFGEMLFTHYGVSGPVVLSATSEIADIIEEKGPLYMDIDLKPALSFEQLDARVLREFEENHNKQFKNAVDKLFPAKLKPVIIDVSGIDPEKKVNEITKEERQNFVRLIKKFTLTLTRLRDFREAIITKGGVSVKEIDPCTMESKKVNHLYFIGEVLDLDAITGGYNLQIAWSTAYLAGNAEL